MNAALCRSLYLVEPIRGVGSIPDKTQNNSQIRDLAPEVGVEPTTSRLTGECSTAELLGNYCSNLNLLYHLRAVLSDTP